MPSNLLVFGFSDAIVGCHGARSMMLPEIKTLARALPGVPSKADIVRAIIEDNVIEKPTLVSRKKSLRHLTELYGLDTSKALFRVLWDLAHTGPASFPQLCLVCAYARDSQLRCSFELLRTLRNGEPFDRLAMEHHFEASFPDRFSKAMKKSLAQNVSTTWSYGGHLVGAVKKRRCLPDPRPVSAAYAMFAGYLSGLRGERLLDSAYAALVSANRAQLHRALALASSRGFLKLRQAAGVVEFDFSSLLTPAERVLIHESN